MDTTPRERMIELRRKKDSLKSKKLGKKESKELRQLIQKNTKLFMIFCWSKEDVEYVKNVLFEKGIDAETFLMPESFNLKFF